MSNHVAVLDACVLYPAFLRDALMSLATAPTPLYRARWTKDIHDEWTRNVHSNVPGVTVEALERTTHQMDESVPDCLISGYQGKIGEINLPDMKDRHVLAAAIVGKADVIVTFNTKHFPESVLEPCGVQCMEPDDFICDLLQQSPIGVVDGLHVMRARFGKPPISVDEFLARLLRQKLPKSVERLREYSKGL